MMIGNIGRDWGFAAILFVFLLFGGATQGGFLANAAVILLAFIAIFFARSGPGNGTGPNNDNIAAAYLTLIAFAAAFVFIIQLIPLPPMIWRLLPGREAIAIGFEVMNMDLPWLSISLAPVNSIYALIWLLPALATFRLASTASWQSLHNSFVILLLFACLSAGVGMLQSAGIPNVYEITNKGEPTGFFANSNHLVTLLLAALPVLGYVLALSSSHQNSRKLGAEKIFIGCAILLFLLAAVSINGARALYFLLPFSLGAGALLFFLGKNRTVPRGLLWATTVIIMAGSIGLMFLVYNDVAGLGGLTGRSASRSTIWPTVLLGAGHYFPVGSGLGSFISAYPAFERPDQISNIFINHAHNDFLELYFETGLVGILFVSLFLLWFGWRTFALWSHKGYGSLLGRMGSIGAMVIILHSLVDYPARTIAISSLLGLFIAIMVNPPKRSSEQKSSGRKFRW